MKHRQTMEDFVLEQFSLLYPAPRSELNFDDPYQLAVAVILSAQCTDRKVNETTPSLFSRWPGFPDLARARIASVEKVIRQVNYYRTKARNIIEMARQVVDRFRGILPSTFEELMSLPGIGRKSAGVILGELRKEHTLPVDTHVFRVSRRLGLAGGDTPERVEMELRSRFAPARWYALHHGLILHGRRVCKARHPLCSDCPLLRRCPFGKERMRK